MIRQERTRQHLDPIGTFTSRSLSIAAVLLAFVLASVATSITIDLFTQPAMAIMALIPLGIACFIVVSATDPYRGPFTFATHNVVVALVLLTATLFAVASWSTSEFLVVAWVTPAALGFLYVAISPYRPAREVVSTGVLAATVIGFITTLQLNASTIEIPPLAVVSVVTVPLLSFNFASAAYSISTIGSIERWQQRASRAVDRLSIEREPGIARSVQQDRVTILNREVVPFFSEVLRKERIGDDDRDRARFIANAIRQVMVAEVDRTWLENLIEHLRTRVRRQGELPSKTRIVFDDENIANSMSYDQRTGFRAFIVAVYDQALNRPEALEIVLATIDGVNHGIVSVKVSQLDGSAKSRFGPYIAVMRVVFRDLRVEYMQSVLTVRFAYE